jgi:hypothetical protein
VDDEGRIAVDDEGRIAVDDEGRIARRGAIGERVDGDWWDWRDDDDWRDLRRPLVEQVRLLPEGAAGNGPEAPRIRRLRWLNALESMMEAAVRHERVSTAQLLLAWGAPLPSLGCVLRALCRGQFEVVRWALAHGAHIDFQDVLRLASDSSRNSRGVLVLLETGWNSPDQLGRLVKVAAGAGNTPLVKKLLVMCCTCPAGTVKLTDAVLVAAFAGNMASALLMMSPELRHMVDPNEILVESAIMGKEKLVRAALTNGATNVWGAVRAVIDAQGDDVLKTLLHWASDEFASDEEVDEDGEGGEGGEGGEDKDIGDGEADGDDEDNVGKDGDFVGYVGEADGSHETYQIPDSLSRPEEVTNSEESDEDAEVPVPQYRRTNELARRYGHHLSRLAVDPDLDVDE